MAYFSNGTEGMIYNETYCVRCQNWGRDSLSKKTEVDGCPIWDAHMAFAYEECNSNSNAKKILDALIPMVDHTASDGISYHIAGECSMFFPKPGQEIPGQMELL